MNSSLYEHVDTDPLQNTSSQRWRVVCGGICGGSDVSVDVQILTEELNETAGEGTVLLCMNVCGQRLMAVFSVSCNRSERDGFFPYRRSPIRVPLPP